MSRTYTSWNMRIGDTAYETVCPLKLKLIPEHKRVLVGHRFFIFPIYTKQLTGRYCIEFTYNRGPLTKERTDSIPFDSEAIARAWFDSTFASVFLKKADVPAPQPPKPVKKKPSLRLL